MENWNNLSKILTLNIREEERKTSNALELINLTLNGTKKEIVELLKNGAILNCYADMTTPLISALLNDKDDLIDFYLKAGATINYKPDEHTNDALWEALINKKYNTLRKFIEAQCQLTRHEEHVTPLIYATKNSDLESVSILLRSKKIKLNERDKDGNTALHINVLISPQSNEDIQIGKLLIAAGADVNSLNIDKQKPSDLATDNAAKASLLNNEIDKMVKDRDQEKELEKEKELDVTPEPVKIKKNKI